MIEMGYRILSREEHQTRHGAWDNKEYRTRAKAKEAFDKFYSGRYAKYKKYTKSMKIVKAKSREASFNPFGNVMKMGSKRWI